MMNTVVSALFTGSLLTLVPGDGASAMYENAPVTVSEPTILPSGVSIQDIRPGDGDIVEEGKRVNIQWVLKRSNGYSIDSSSNNDGVPFILSLIHI